MDAGIQSDINALIRKLHGMEAHMKRGVKTDLGKAAKIIAVAVSAAAPVGNIGHVRRVGAGKVLYPTGNLKRSIKVLRFRRARSAVFVGPKSAGNLPDGFYAPFLEFGTKNIAKGRHSFIEKAANASKDSALREALRLLRDRVLGYAKSNAAPEGSTSSNNFFQKYAKAKGRI